MGPLPHTPIGEHPVTTHRAIARRRYPRAEWITGEGPWASLAACGVLTVILYPTREQAEAARAFIDQTGCGGGCYRDHAVVNIEGATR